MLADTLAGRVTAGNVHDFACHIQEFAELLSAVPGRELTPRDERELAAVIRFCSFGFAGAWPPKITKVGALFRPEAIPVLDGYLALAFGFPREAFSAGVRTRRPAIQRVVTALATRITAQGDALSGVRRRAEEQVPAVALSDLRLADIIIWTAQDDRMERPGKPRNLWLRMEPGKRRAAADVVWLPLAGR